MPSAPGSATSTMTYVETTKPIAAGIELIRPSSRKKYWLRTTSKIVHRVKGKALCCAWVDPRYYKAKAEEVKKRVSDAGGRLSDSFGQLLALCLDKQPQMRPSARDLLKHPWFRQPDPLELRAGSGGGARHDASARQALDRSRSNLQDLDVSAMLGTMNLGQDR